MTMRQRNGRDVTADTSERACACVTLECVFDVVEWPDGEIDRKCEVELREAIQRHQRVVEACDTPAHTFSDIGMTSQCLQTHFMLFHPHLRLSLPAPLTEASPPAHTPVRMT